MMILPRFLLRRFPAVAVLTSTLLISGCALTPWIPHPAAPARPLTLQGRLDADDLPSYMHDILPLSHEALAAEQSTRRERANLARGALERAKLAVALTLPIQGQRDTTRALLAITDVPRDDPALDAKSLGIINYIQTLLAWQAHQEEVLQSLLQPEHVAGPAVAPPPPGPPPEVASLQALAQRLRADQKKNEQQIDALTARLRDEKARADALQLKLDALGNLEKSLVEWKAARPDPQK